MCLYLFTYTGVQHDFYVIIFVSFNTNTTVVTSVAGTANHRSTGVHPVFYRVLVGRSLVFCLMFRRPLFVLLSFSIRHCFVCSSLIDEFLLPLWYLPPLLTLSTLNVPTITINLDHSATAFLSTMAL